MMIAEIPPEQTMWVISNEKGINGAASMLYENELHELAESLESDLYILPSSVHEVIVSDVLKIVYAQIFALLMNLLNVLF